MADYVARRLRDRAVPQWAIDARQETAYGDRVFVERVFKHQGKPFVQARHHELWWELTRKHNRCVMWYPIEHGKTSQTKARLCKLLGNHGTKQFAYVSSKQKQARKVVRAVKNEIDGNADLQTVFPRLRAARNPKDGSLVEWGSTGITVAEKPLGEKDPSLAAYGLDGDILGSRLHGVIIDNGLDKRNTRSAGLREWARTVIEDEIIGRVHEGGFVWILDTAWHDDDYMHEFERRGWPSIRLDATEPLPGTEGPTLWPAQFPQERLDARLAELGKTAFDRQYRNRPLSESLDYFKETFWNAALGRASWRSEWPDPPKGVQLRTGVDLASRKKETADDTAFVTTVADGYKRQLVHCDGGKMKGMEIIRYMVAYYKAVHHPVNMAGGDAQFVVEDNAAQDYIVDMMRDAAVLGALGLTLSEVAAIRVKGRTTTSVKRDQELGIQGLAAALETGRYDIARHENMKLLREDCRVWSPEADHYGDYLMAWWIGASDLRTTQQGSQVVFI